MLAWHPRDLDTWLHIGIREQAQAEQDERFAQLQRERAGG